MPPPWEAAQTHKAVLWERVGIDRDGEVKVSDVPEEIDCRWEDGKARAGGAQTEPTSVDATLILGRMLIIGSKIWKGRKQDLPGASWTEAPEPLMVVVSARRVPDEKGRDEAFQAGLRWHKSTLPEQE